MRESLRRKAEEALGRGDYKALAALCLELLEATEWLEAWRKIDKLARSSGEYVLAKFLASAYALADDGIYKALSPMTREFLARDVVVCLEKASQVLESQLFSQPL